MKIIMMINTVINMKIEHRTGYITPQIGIQGSGIIVNCKSRTSKSFYLLKTTAIL